MTWFDRAGGKVLAGLKNRREYGDATRMGERELYHACVRSELKDIRAKTDTISTS